jgi:hypothetical protein
MGTLSKQMNDEQKYLIGMLISALALSGMAILDGWLLNSPIWKVIVTFLVLVAIYGVAFFLRRWYGRGVLFLHILIKAPVPLIVGLICALTGSKKTGMVTACVIGFLPVVFMLLALISHAQGLTPVDWHPKRFFIPMAVGHGSFWFLSTLYVQSVVVETRRKQG